jgi:hypothetical protein
VSTRGKKLRARTKTAKKAKKTEKKDCAENLYSWIVEENGGK